MWWNRENVAAIFVRPASEIPWLFADAVDSLKTSPVAPVVAEDAPSQEVVISEPDLYKIPIPTHALLGRRAVFLQLRDNRQGP